jgi:hypothetical protein
VILHIGSPLSMSVILPIQKPFKLGELLHILSQLLKIPSSRSIALPVVTTQPACNNACRNYPKPPFNEDCGDAQFFQQSL